jgi:5-methylcytosine-specific restriction endonuclease McrA
VPPRRRPSRRFSPAYARAKRIRSSYAWQQLVKVVVVEEPVCWLRLWGCTRRSTTGDHVVPVSVRPEWALLRWNVKGACESCNYRRGGRAVSELGPLRLPPDERVRARRHVGARRRPAAAVTELFGRIP